MWATAAGRHAHASGMRYARGGVKRKRSVRSGSHKLTVEQIGD